MSPATNYNEEQIQEIEALQAIYMDDYAEVETKSAWSKTTDRSFRLTIRSSADEDSSAILLVKFNATYPKTPPLLEITGLEGYHERTRERIRNLMRIRPKQLLGEPMIYTIASEVQEALEDAVSARQQGTLPSLEDERASAEEVASALARETEEAEAKRQREAQEEEDRVLKQMLDEELIRREKRKSIKPAPSLPTQSTVDGKDVVSFDQPATVNTGSERLEFSAVTIISSLAQKTDEQLYLAKPQITSSASGALVAVKKITTTKGRDDIMQIESMLEKVRNLRHTNILGLLAYQIERVDNAISQMVLCSEYADRGTLHDMLEMVDHLQIDKARRFTVELLEALEYLHHNGVAHGSLSSSSVFMSSGNSSLSPKLGQLGQSMLQGRSKSLAPKWEAPEGLDVKATSLHTKSDIWYLVSSCLTGSMIAYDVATCGLLRRQKSRADHKTH